MLPTRPFVWECVEEQYLDYAIIDFIEIRVLHILAITLSNSCQSFPTTFAIQRQVMKRGFVASDIVSSCYASPVSILVVAFRLL